MLGSCGFKFVAYNHTAEMLPEDGEPIVEAENVMFWQEENKVTVMIEGEKGVRTEITLTLRSGEAKDEK